MRNLSSMFRNKTGTLPGTIFQFSYIELELATNKFDKSNLIGFGGSSHVYRGQLKDGRIVAVKRLKTQGGPDADNVFLTEVFLVFHFGFSEEQRLRAAALETSQFLFIFTD